MGRGYTFYNLRIILVLTCGSLTFGYGFSVISNTIGQPGFLSYFDLEHDGARNQAISGSINGLFCAGAIMGSLMVGWMAEARGRKETMYLSCVINIIGEALEAGSINLGMFLASRFIAGWGIGSMVVLIPILQSEICTGRSPVWIQRADALASLQLHPAPEASWSVSTAPGSCSATRLPAGSVQVLFTRRMERYNGVSP